MKLEVCCSNIPSIRAAIKGGADRVELCRDLELDGLTPGYDMIADAVAICHAADVLVHVLIRPRAGNFHYSQDEFVRMCDDIKQAVALGADGIVIGPLTASGDIDTEMTDRMIQCARLCSGDRRVSITFHRAFDVCNQPFKALGEIIRLGCDRILTSGQQPTAERGIPLLRELVRKADDRIIILCGAGVNTENAACILRETGATELHGSLRTGAITDASKVRTVRHILDNLGTDK